MNALVTPDTLTLADFVEHIGPALCDRCENADAGHRRGYCAECAPDGVVIGAVCGGLLGEACVAFGARLADGCFETPAGERGCAACAMHATGGA
jgi:hypothetical protein